MSNAPPSGQPNDMFDVPKLRQSAREHKEPQVRDNDLSDVVSLKMPDDSTYEGTVDKTTKLKHGFGTQVWQDGAKYVGEWKDGKAEGNGTFFHSNGDVFEGEFKQDKANGYGTYKHKSGQTYEGYWNDDLQEG